MKLEELIRQRAEEYLKTATRLATESALTGDIWLRVICREKSEVYSAAADGLLTALHDAEDVAHGRLHPLYHMVHRVQRQDR